jgi:hypothetical protein
MTQVELTWSNAADTRSAQSERDKHDCTDGVLLLSPECVAERLGVKVQWVIRQSRAGKIPHRRLGKAYRYVPAEIEKWAKGESHVTKSLH